MSQRDVCCRATWEQIQEARVKAIGLLSNVPAGNTAARLVLLRDATACSLLSLVPPDRVGLVRKLRLGHTLKRREGGGWRLDLTKARDGHKTSAQPLAYADMLRTRLSFNVQRWSVITCVCTGRFYGPFAAALPDELNGVLDAYSSTLELEVGGTEAYLFHPVRSGAIDRPVESSAWTSYVKSLFTRLVGTGVAPKTLRSIFITWLRSATHHHQPLCTFEANPPHSLWSAWLAGRTQSVPRF